jgi:hypothetical protein
VLDKIGNARRNQQKFDAAHIFNCRNLEKQTMDEAVATKQLELQAKQYLGSKDEYL